LRRADSKSAARTVLLGAPALEFLAGLPPVEGNPDVLPGKLFGRPDVALGKAWKEKPRPFRLPPTVSPRDQTFGRLLKGSSHRAL
jgi:hypothetical protein